MLRKKILSISLAGFIIASVLLGCGSSTVVPEGTEKGLNEAASGAEEIPEESKNAAAGFEAGEWRRYSPAISAEFGMEHDINSDAFTAMANAGEPYDNNRWIQMFRDEVGIECSYKLISPNAEDYQQKLVLAMTSGDLPDIFHVNDLALYKQMVDAGVIADLTDVYEREANPTLKSIVEGEGTGFIDNFKFDGKLYCIPGKMPSTNGYSYLWIRKDWLDKLGLEIPKTMDDVMEVARAFVEQDPDGNGKDDTLGLSIDENYTVFGSMGIFWAYGGQAAGKKFWSKLEDGTVGYSMVQPEMKGGLKWLQEMYVQGLLNPEFSTQSFTDIGPMIANNSLGMFYGCHWYAGQINGVKSEIPDAEWIPILAPGTDGNPAPVYASVDMNGIYCVRADYEHPEALIAMFNAYTEKQFGEKNDFENYFACKENGNLWQSGPIHMLDADVDIEPFREMKKAMDEGTLDTLTGVGGSYWKYIQEGDLSYKLMFGPEGSCFELVDATYPDIFTWNSYQGAPTPTQSERWSSMQEIIDTSYIKMITGEEDVDEGFDKMVSDWMAAGGDKVTEEVNAIVAGK